MKLTFIDPLHFRVIFLENWWFSMPLGGLCFWWVFQGYSLFETKPDGWFFLWGFLIFLGCFGVGYAIHSYRALIPPRGALALTTLCLFVAIFALGYFALYSSGPILQTLMGCTLWWCPCYLRVLLKHNKTHHFYPR